MAENLEVELYKQHRGAQEKHTYFLLAAVGACIGFAATQTKDLALQPNQWPLGLAIAAWALSFWCGCVHARSAGALMFANMALLKLQDGRDPMMGTDPQRIAIGVEACREIIEGHNTTSTRSGRWQFRFLALGVAAYVAWHIMEMAARM